MSLISHENYADVATLTSPDTIDSLNPLSNLKDPRLAKVARTSPLATFPSQLRVRVDLGTSYTQRPVRVLAFLAIAQQWGAWGAGSIQAPSLTYSLSNTGFGIATIGGGTIAFADRAFEAIPKNFIHVFSSDQVGRYWEVFLTMDLGSLFASAQAGRLWMGPAFSLVDSLNSAGVDANWSIDHVDPSVVRRSRGQQVYVDEKPRYRVLNFSVSNIPRQLMFGDNASPYLNAWRSLQEIVLTAGVSREIITIPRDMTQVGGVRQFVNRTGIYGYLTGQPKAQHQGGDLYTMSFQVQEAR